MLDVSVPRLAEVDKKGDPLMLSAAEIQSGIGAGDVSAGQSQLLAVRVGFGLDKISPDQQLTQKQDHCIKDISRTLRSGDVW